MANNSRTEFHPMQIRKIRTISAHNYSDKALVSRRWLPRCLCQEPGWACLPDGLSSREFFASLFFTEPWEKPDRAALDGKGFFSGRPTTTTDGKNLDFPSTGLLDWHWMANIRLEVYLGPLWKSKDSVDHIPRFPIGKWVKCVIL